MFSGDILSQRADPNFYILPIQLFPLLLTFPSVFNLSIFRWHFFALSMPKFWLYIIKKVKNKILYEKNACKVYFTVRIA